MGSVLVDEIESVWPLGDDVGVGQLSQYSQKRQFQGRQPGNDKNRLVIRNHAGGLPLP